MSPHRQPATGSPQPLESSLKAEEEEEVAQIRNPWVTNLGRGKTPENSQGLGTVATKAAERIGTHGGALCSKGEISQSAHWPLAYCRGPPPLQATHCGFHKGQAQGFPQRFKSEPSQGSVRNQGQRRSAGARA